MYLIKANWPKPSGCDNGLLGGGAIYSWKIHVANTPHPRIPSRCPGADRKVHHRRTEQTGAPALLSIESRCSGLVPRVTWLSHLTLIDRGHNLIALAAVRPQPQLQPALFRALWI